jgi:predicted nucleic acid-binding protein
MVLGIDTGFLLLLGQEHPRCTELWNGMHQGEHVPSISTLCIAEYIGFHIQRGKFESAEQFIRVLENLPNVSLAPVSRWIAAQSARYRVGMGLSTVDSIIFSTAILEGCTLFVTTDSVFNQESVRNLIPVELLS